MKTINYTGSSKLISRIVHLLNRKAPLPLDGDGDAVWGTNGQVLTTDGQGGTSWKDVGGGDVTDVEVNGTSVVNAQGVAEVSVPTNTSDLNNDSGFITNLVNDLANYYTKSQTYTQAEVNALISGIVTLNILVVQALPTQDISTTTIYLVPKQDAGTDDIYDEYLYINNAWELIGTTQIDLSNYVTTTDLSTALADYVTSVGLATILAGYVQSSDLAAVATSGSYNDLSNKPTIQTLTEGDGIDISNDEISVDTTFTEASTRTNIASGDSLATIWGKIKKFFTDIKTVAFTGAYSDLSGTENVAIKNADNQFSANQTIDRKDGTTSSAGISALFVGNNKAVGSAQNSKGVIGLYGQGQFYTFLAATNATANRGIELPDKNGTVSLLEDFKPSAGTTAGLTSSYGTILTGYVRVGNLVILNVRFAAGSSNIPAGSLFVNGLPAATEGGLNHVACVTNSTVPVQINGSALQNQAAIPAGTILFVSATYLTGM